MPFVVSTPPDLPQNPSQGRSFPLGATLCPGGVNFSVFSKHSTSVELLLFDHVNDAKPSRVIKLDPHVQRTYHYWHVFVAGIGAGQVYAFRADGQHDPSSIPAVLGPVKEGKADVVFGSRFLGLDSEGMPA